MEIMPAAMREIENSPPPLPSDLKNSGNKHRRRSPKKYNVLYRYPFAIWIASSMNLTLTRKQTAA